LDFEELYEKIIGCINADKTHLYLGFFIGDKTEYFESGKIMYRPDNGHAMAILIDLVNRYVELFDPKGVPYNDIQYSWFKSFIFTLNSKGFNFTYSDNTHYSKQIQGITKDDIFCVYWSLLWIELRISNPKLNSKDVYSILTSFSSNQLMSIIRKYVNYVNLCVRTK